MKPIRTLFEREPAGAETVLPEDLRAVYGGDLQFPLDVIEYLFFRQRISFNCGCSSDPFRKIHLVKVLIDLGIERDPGEMFTF